MDVHAVRDGGGAFADEVTDGGHHGDAAVHDLGLAEALDALKVAALAEAEGVEVSQGSRSAGEAVAGLGLVGDPAVEGLDDGGGVELGGEVGHGHGGGLALDGGGGSLGLGGGLGHAEGRGGGGDGGRRSEGGGAGDGSGEDGELHFWFVCLGGCKGGFGRKVSESMWWLECSCGGRGARCSMRHFLMCSSH